MPLPLALYEKILSLDWHTHLPPEQTQTSTQAKRPSQITNEKKEKLLANVDKLLDKSLANVACDHGDDGVPAGQNLGSLCMYLWKYTNNHAKNSLTPETRSAHLLMPESGKADLLPSTPLTGTATDSPWVTTSSTTNFPHTTRKKRNWFFSRHASVQENVHCQTKHPSPLHATLHRTWTHHPRQETLSREVFWPFWHH